MESDRNGGHRSITSEGCRSMVNVLNSEVDQATERDQGCEDDEKGGCHHKRLNRGGFQLQYSHAFVGSHFNGNLAQDTGVLHEESLDRSHSVHE